MQDTFLNICFWGWLCVYQEKQAHFICKFQNLQMWVSHNPACTDVLLFPCRQQPCGGEDSVGDGGTAKMSRGEAEVHKALGGYASVGLVPKAKKLFACLKPS